MAQFVLEILDGDRAGEVVSLGDRTIRIGRKPQNDLVVADEKASGVHAEIAFEGDRHVLRDLGSTNGTLMDGRKITEVVLGSGDTFSIGRVRLRFRGEGEAAAAGADGGIAVDRIDAARLQAAGRGSRSVGLLVGLLVVALGAGGYLWWKGQAGGGGEAGAGGAHGPKPELKVAGNKLQQETAACEAEIGWDLQVAGAGFRLGGRANTGHGGLEASRGEAQAGDAAGFAIAATNQELKVLAGRTVGAAAHLHTTGAGRATVRLAFWSSSEGAPFRFVTGAPLQAHESYERIAISAAVPAGADRCRVEVVAVLPDDQSSVAVDDVAVLEEGQEAAIERRIGESATAIGCGQSFALRSMDPEQPATVLGCTPGRVDAALEGLRLAGQLALSDVGATVALTNDDRSLTVAITGCAAVELAFPADSASGMTARGDAGFAGVDANAGFRASEVLLGDRSTRCLVQLAAPDTFSSRSSGGVYRLLVPVTNFTLAVGFRAERQQARELLRQAEEAAHAGQPGAALDGLRELLRTVPHDAETLGQAVARRGEWQEALAAQLRRTAVELDDATFFDTRGSFERIVRRLDELVSVYGDRNVEDPDAIKAMRSRAAARLEELDAVRSKEQQQRRQRLAAAFEQAGMPALAALLKKE